MTTDRNSEAACHRVHTPTGKWTWIDGAPTQQAQDDCRNWGWVLEYAYTTPPATIPAAEVRLTYAEQCAIDGLLSDLAHEVGDVEDSVPDMGVDEDAYWAYRKYHAIQKLLTLLPENPQ